MNSRIYLLGNSATRQNLTALIIFLVSDNKSSTLEKISTKLYFGSRNKISSTNNFYENTFLVENNFYDNFTSKLSTKYTSIANSHGLASSLGDYSFRDISMNLYLTKNLVSNLNSSKQTR